MGQGPLLLSGVPPYPGCCHRVRALARAPSDCGDVALYSLSRVEPIDRAALHARVLHRARAVIQAHLNTRINYTVPLGVAHSKLYAAAAGVPSRAAVVARALSSAPGSDIASAVASAALSFALAGLPRGLDTAASGAQ